MDTGQIHDFFHTSSVVSKAVRNNFCGVFAIDQVADSNCAKEDLLEKGQKVLEKCFQCDADGDNDNDGKLPTVRHHFAIVNSDPINEPGTHWLLMLFVGEPFNLCFVFDSFGEASLKHLFGPDVFDRNGPLDIESAGVFHPMGLIELDDEKLLEMDAAARRGCITIENCEMLKIISEKALAISKSGGSKMKLMWNTRAYQDNTGNNCGYFCCLFGLFFSRALEGLSTVQDALEKGLDAFFNDPYLNFSKPTMTIVNPDTNVILESWRVRDSKRVTEYFEGLAEKRFHINAKEGV